MSLRRVFDLSCAALTNAVQLALLAIALTGGSQ